MTDINLTLACGPFDRTQALRDGSVKPEGINLTYLALEPAEVFYRMINFREFDVSELSITNYITLVSLASRRSSPFRRFRPGVPPRLFLHQHRQAASRCQPTLRASAAARWSIARPRAFICAASCSTNMASGRATSNRCRRGPTVSAQAAARLKMTTPAAGLAAGRSSGARRDRLSAVGQPARRVPARLAQGGAAVPELSRSGNRLLQTDENLSDHASDRDPEGRARSPPLGRAEPLQGVPHRQRARHEGAAHAGAPRRRSPGCIP